MTALARIGDTVRVTYELGLDRWSLHGIYRGPCPLVVFGLQGQAFEADGATFAISNGAIRSVRITSRSAIMGAKPGTVPGR